MRSFDSPVSIKSVKDTILTISLFFTFFSTCNSNTLLTEDHVLTFVNVTLVRDDGLQKVAHKLFCLNFSDILSEIYIFSGLEINTALHVQKSVNLHTDHEHLPYVSANNPYCKTLCHTSRKYGGG